MKHFTGLAHIALFTKDLKTSTAFYEALGGVVTDHADVEKPTGTNHIVMVQMPGFFLEIIEPHDGSPVTAEGGLFPHIAIEVDDIYRCKGCRSFLLPHGRTHDHAHFRRNPEPVL